MCLSLTNGEAGGFVGGSQQGLERSPMRGPGHVQPLVGGGGFPLPEAEGFSAEKRPKDEKTQHKYAFGETVTVFYRDVPNNRFVFAWVPNSGRNSVFVFGRIVSSERIRIVSLYSTELETSDTADFTQSVPAALAQTA